MYKPSRHIRPNLPQTLRNPQNAINQQSIRRTLNLKVAKESIGAEQSQDFVEGVVGFGVGLGRLGGGERDERELHGGAADFGAQGEEGECADGLVGAGGLPVEDAVVGLGWVLVCVPCSGEN